MKSRIYYGEYSLMHWIKLMLTGNIVLPEYQRQFVWEKNDLKRLVKSLIDGQFVAPVTIALYNDNTNKKNLIIDGQQRLTSLLIAYLRYFPIKSKFEKDNEVRTANEDDSASDEEQFASTKIKWKFEELLKYGDSKDTILAKLRDDDRYESLTERVIPELDNSFFENNYLGFSYIVPESSVKEEIQMNFSKLFRNINYFGKKLDPMESRKSLYYQNSYLTNFFEGKCPNGADVLCDMSIIEDFKPCKFDFVRYLSILSQYHISKRDYAEDVMKGFSAYSFRETFYADYVSFLLGIDQEFRIDKFDGFNFNEVFPENAWQERFVTLHNAIAKLQPIMPLKDGKSFNSWYEADYWLFGLMYHIVFRGCTLREGEPWEDDKYLSNDLKENLKKAIATYRHKDVYSKNTNRLGNIRYRLVDSCNIFAKYVQK